MAGRFENGGSGGREIAQPEPKATRREGGLPPRGGDSTDSGYRRDGREGQNAPAGLKTALFRICDTANLNGRI